MKISLIIATKERVTEVDQFMESLEKQRVSDIELIVVDQNEDDRLVPVIKRYSNSLSILHLKSKPGLSKARNLGMKFIENADIVAFPDDDCIYPENTLRTVIDYFKENPEFDGLTGRSIDFNHHSSAGNFSKEAGQLNLYNVWKQGISFTIFLKKNVIDNIKGFDEELGVGANTAWGSGEETDYLIRSIKQGFNINYTPELKIIHPDPILDMNPKTYQRAYSYGAGMGRVLKKNHYPLWFKSKMLFRPFAGYFLSLIRFNFKKSYFYYRTFMGRARGVSSSER